MRNLNYSGDEICNRNQLFKCKSQYLMCKLVNASFQSIKTTNNSVWFCFYTFELQKGIIHLVRMRVFRKINIFNPMIHTRAGVRNVSFSGNFANILSEWSQIFLISFVHPLYSILDKKYLPVESPFRRSVLRLLFSLKTWKLQF